MKTAVVMVEFHGFPTLMVPIVFPARRVSKILVISSLIAQNSKIILNRKVMSSNPTDGTQIANLSVVKIDSEKAFLLVRGLRPLYDRATATLTTTFVATVISKI